MRPLLRFTIQSSLGSFDLLDQFGNDLVQITDDAVGGNIEDGGVLVLVDGDDGLGVLHAGHVLDSTGDAQGNIDAGMHGLAGLADLMVGRQPARIGDGITNIIKVYALLVLKKIKKEVKKDRE